MMHSSYSLIILLLSFILVCSLFYKMYRARYTIKLSEHQMARLLALAKQSLDSLDVPIGALLIYKNEIIGEGYNTVLRTSDAGGHAEINAISDAIKRLGMERFSSLDRSSLFLATTFEPCFMCAGAFLNYNIRQIYFLKRKDFLYLSKEGARFIRYYFRRGKMKHAGEQDALFELHPQYPLRKINADITR
jgi:tRNA(Arg) A34 adenosine deaminase TadA